jgi:colicin import membrane protein
MIQEEEFEFPEIEETFPDEVFADEPKGMAWQAVDSSQISEIGWDGRAEYPLGIKFPPNKKQKEAGLPGSRYDYKNVTAELHAEFLAAKDNPDYDNSIGTFFGRRIKRFPETYPFVKVEETVSLNGALFEEIPIGEVKPNPPQLVRTTTQVSSGDIQPTNTNGAKTTRTHSQASDTSEPVTYASLALLNTMPAKDLFAPGGITDAQLEAGRAWYLAESKKYGIATKEERAQFARFARPLQKLRTGIEARAKEFTGETKRQLAAIDTEKRRLVAVVGGIEDEVLAPLTNWESKEQLRISRHTAVLADIHASQPHVYPTVDALRARIDTLAVLDPEYMEEFSEPIRNAKTAVLKVLRDALAQRMQEEANRAELEKLRQEAAARDEASRQAALALAIKEQEEREAIQRELRAAAELAEATQKIQQQKEEAEKRAKEAEERRIADEQASVVRAREAQARGDREKAEAVEAERKRAADAAAEEYRQMEARAADQEHRVRVNAAAVNALIESCDLDGANAGIAWAVVNAIAEGLIPQVTINY